MPESLNGPTNALGTNVFPNEPAAGALDIFSNSPDTNGVTILHSFRVETAHLVDLIVRMCLAAVLGLIVAWIYRRTRKSTDSIASFPPTLVLLSILISMVTQVVGGNIARAFSLVGALSIVRFRTVVRDTQDTAYVIFAVVVGMAIGAADPWVALLGIVVIGTVAFTLRRRAGSSPDAQPAFHLTIRLPVGFQMDPLLKVVEPFVQGLDLLSVSTAKQGVSMDYSYETRLQPHTSPEELVKALNRVEGVQSVEFQRRNLDQD